MNAVRPINILLVEDTEADVELVKFCLKKNKLHVNLEVKMNGADAVEYLFKRGEYADAQTPDIVLLDINLPGMNGIDVLKEIKHNDKTKMIPVVMLTCSKQDEDVFGAYSNYANCFVQKPLELSSFQKIINTFESFWLTIVTLPSDAKDY